MFLGASVCYFRSPGKICMRLSENLTRSMGKQKIKENLMKNPDENVWVLCKICETRQHWTYS